MQRDNITFQEKMNELRLDISNPISKNKTFVLVEGESDVVFFRKFFNDDTTNIERIPEGKFKLEQALVELLLKHKLVIGIRDADFLHLEKKMLEISNLFLTDFHDLELTISYNDVVFSALINEYSSMIIKNHKDIRGKLLKTISFVGYCRWYSEINNLGLNFKSVGFGDVLLSDFFSIDERKFIEKLLKQSKLLSNDFLEELLQGIKSLQSEQHDMFQLCNGHDFMKILSLYLQQKPTTKTKGLNEKTLSSTIRIAYNLSHFKETKLFSSIFEWSRVNNCSIYK